MRQFDHIRRFDHGAIASANDDYARFGRAGRSFILFGYASAGWGLLALLLFGLSDLL